MDADGAGKNKGAMIGTTILSPMKARSEQMRPDGPGVEATAMSQQRTKKSRYSEEFLVAVNHMLSVDDPAAEARYHTRMHDITAEPAETLARARHNARVAVENCRTGEYGAVIAEDFIFIELERRIQRLCVDRLRAGLKRWYRIAAAGGVVSLAGAGFTTLAALSAAPAAITVLAATTTGTGALLLLIGLASSTRKHLERRKAKRWITEIDLARQRRAELE